MKKTMLLLLILFAELLQAQTAGGKVIVDSLYSARLENPMGEATTRALSVYLPPGYDNSGERYPVIYFLHGFMGDHTLYPQMVDILDHAIEKKKIRPFILVISDQKTTYDGSFYSNSGLFGNWEDFTALDLVGYMDTHYRTLPDKNSRGITGHSMGGYGALKIAMHHPDIFGSVYALSPGALAIVREYGPNSTTYRDLAAIRTAEELSNSYFPRVIVAFGRSWSPNPDNPPFYCDVPFEYQGDSLVTRPEVLAKWQANMPVHMIEDNLENLRQLRGIALDWGRNAGERFTQQCNMFSQRLENANITHFAEEYIGTHTSGIYTRDGRIPNDMLPFFDRYLSFESD
ncbi:alpha/beta hydrolase family protein [Robiginitalea sp. SC105]|uniref:alpha/beta hydrolase n=1 Tax=Robiginitalea sp. SC105 TaxID=2762332 RepID=UPI0016398632|nr:alpha/beta hydrolase-fold protein [Robiginitalea sp. SC105]MBC2839207.1 esterase family protein [Robiginitalea sp. SC105]